MAEGRGETESRRTSFSSIIILQLLTGMALFGSSTPLSKIVGSHFSVFTASFLRMAIATLVLLPFAWFSTARLANAKRSDWIVIVAVSLFGMVGFTAAMLFGMRLTTGVIGSTIMSATPAVTAGAAVLFFGAAMNWRKAGALTLSVIGIVYINLIRTGGEGQSDAPLIGAALVALAICFEAAYTLLSRKLSDGVSSLEATLAASMIAGVLFIFLALAFDPRPFEIAGVGSKGWLSVFFWGAVTGGLAPVLWYSGARRAPGALTAGAMAIMPISALGLSYLLLGEAFRWSHLIGFGLVFIGLVLMIFEHAKRTSREGENKVQDRKP